MEIRDDFLNQNIDVLFQYPIIIYGAGWDGKKMRWLLEMTSLKIDCFVDKKPGKKIEGYQVIQPEQMAERAKEKVYIFILSSSLYYMDMFQDLKKYVQFGYVYTGRAIEEAIINHWADCCPNVTKEEYVSRWHKWGLEKAEATLASDTNLMLWIPPKVGSTTIKFTLEKRGLEVVHIHELDSVIARSEIAKQRFEEKRKLPRLKIICIVREPIARDLSHFMEYQNSLLAEGINDVKEYLLKSAVSNYQFLFYDRQIKKNLGIDIYKFPFDRKLGYGIIREGNVDILILKLEKLGQNINILGDFVGIQDLELMEGNIGSKKPYGKKYEQIKMNYRIPKSVIRLYYEENDRVDHFYTECEKAFFIEKYKDRII